MDAERMPAYQRCVQAHKQRRQTHNFPLLVMIPR